MLGKSWRQLWRVAGLLALLLDTTDTSQPTGYPMSTLPLSESPPPRIEDEIEKLESLVRELETGQEGLEHALSLFEQGVRLTAQCQTRLEAFDQRILEVTREADGSASLKSCAHDPTQPAANSGRS